MGFVIDAIVRSHSGAEKPSRMTPQGCVPPYAAGEPVGGVTFGLLLREVEGSLATPAELGLRTAGPWVMLGG